MKIAVYSGSFDPLHIGHLAILRSICESGEFDCTYLIVSPQNPFKAPEKSDNAFQRFEAAKEAVARHPELNVKVDDIELHLDPPQYTLNTLEALEEREKDNEFSLVIGADNLACFRLWRGYMRLLYDYGVTVYPREGYDLEKIRDDLLAEDDSYRINIIDAPLVNISSTELREMAARGEDISRYLM